MLLLTPPWILPHCKWQAQYCDNKIEKFLEWFQSWFQWVSLCVQRKTKLQKKSNIILEGCRKKLRDIYMYVELSKYLTHWKLRKNNNVVLKVSEKKIPYIHVGLQLTVRGSEFWITPMLNKYRLFFPFHLFLSFSPHSFMLNFAGKCSPSSVTQNLQLICWNMIIVPFSCRFFTRKTQQQAIEILLFNMEITCKLISYAKSPCSRKCYPIQYNCKLH